MGGDVESRRSRDAASALDWERGHLARTLASGTLALP